MMLRTYTRVTESHVLETRDSETRNQRSEIKMRKTLIPSVINLGTCRFKYYMCKADLLIQNSIQLPTKSFVPKEIICEIFTRWIVYLIIYSAYAG